MPNNRQNNENNGNRSLEERKALLQQLHDNWASRYAWMLTNYQMPAPKTAPSMQNVDLSAKQMAQVPIAALQKSVLCGTIVGDSSFNIGRNYRSPRCQNRHSTRQCEWFFWKWLICLREFNNGLQSITFQDPDGHQRNAPMLAGENLGKLKISTKANNTLLQLHNVICENNCKKIDRSWLNHMTDYFLMTVWLDDGSLTNGRQGEIALDETPLQEQKVFVDYLKAVWDVECFASPTNDVMQNGERRHRIKIKDQENLLKFLRIVALVIPVKEMLYKVMFVPVNNIGLLERWASELASIVQPQFKEYIVKEYEKIIANYDKA